MGISWLTTRQQLQERPVQLEGTGTFPGRGGEEGGVEGGSEAVRERGETERGTKRHFIELFRSRYEKIWIS